MQILDEAEVQFARIPLVGGRRIDETVAQDDAAAFQAGQDLAAHVLRAGCAEQQQFRLVRDILFIELYEQLADMFAENRAARLPRDDDFVFLFGQPFRQHFDLRRFSGAFRPFERHKQSIFNRLLRHGCFFI